MAVNGSVVVTVTDGNIEVNVHGLNRQDALRTMAETLLGFALSENPERTVVQQTTPGLLRALLGQSGGKGG